MIRLFVTGHRPDKLGGYTKESHDRLVATAIKALKQLHPASVTTGMALGWDIAVAEACIELCIPFVAAVPFKGQEAIWPQKSKDEYKRILDQAAVIKVVSLGGYRPQKMAIRNHWMVDNNDAGLALWNGDRTGGTFECVQYAMVKSTQMYNAWELYNNTKDYVTRLTQV